MAGFDDAENVYELVEPVKQHFRGVCALLHDCDESSVVTNYLLNINDELGGGNIIFGNYVGRHNHSRNRILYETGMEEGDYFVTLDSLERVIPEFAESLPNLILQIEFQNIDICYYYNMPYVVRFREDMFYHGTPHESLLADNPLNRIELNQYLPDESKVRINVRPLKRDKNHHIAHYIRYLLQPNSNHNLLGIEHHGGYEAFLKLESLRKLLIKALKDNNLPRTIDGVKKLLSKPLDGITRVLLNEHGEINNFYRYYILGEEVVDTHDWLKLPKF